MHIQLYPDPAATIGPLKRSISLLAVASGLALLFLWKSSSLLEVHRHRYTATTEGFSFPRPTLATSRRVELISSPSPPPTSSAHALGFGVDLDARYPPEIDFWSSDLRHRSECPWLEPLRAKLLRHRGDGVVRLKTIPEKIHQTWKDAAPPRKLFSPRWAQSLRVHNPGWSYRLWTDAENRKLVSEVYPHLLTIYDGYGSPIQRADVARYVIAHARGGVYADLDTECFGPFSPLTSSASFLLSYKTGANFSRGACNSIFGSAKAHPFWDVVFDVLHNRSLTPLSAGHTAVLYSTGPAVLREALRRLLRLPPTATITPAMLKLLRTQLGIVVLDANVLHPVTAERRHLAKGMTADDRVPGSVCMHHFVSSWVDHSSEKHALTERRRQAGDVTAAMHGEGQSVFRENLWKDGKLAGPHYAHDGAANGGPTGKLQSSMSASSRAHGTARKRKKPSQARGASRS